MQFILVLIFLFNIVGFTKVYAQDTSSTISQTSGSGLQFGSLMNPNISVIGWIQSQVGNTPTSLDNAKGTVLKEAEVGFQSVVDPYARADFFASFDGEGKADMEEGYITFLALPYNFQVKGGKFQANFGKFNRTHPGETYFADRPLSVQRFIGDEPLRCVGASVSRTIPNPWDAYINADVEISNTPSENPSFDSSRNEDLFYLERLSYFTDLTESTNLNLGAAYANGANGFEVNQVDGSSSTRRNHLVALDLTLRWKNPRRSIYSSLTWQTEFYWTKRNLSPDSDKKRGGGFSYINYQFARRWHTGIRGDWVQRLDLDDGYDADGLIYLTFTPSEFSLISLQGKHVKFADGCSEDIGFLKVTFNIGPHGVHPF